MDTLAQKHSLWNFYNEVQAFEFSDPARVRRRLDEFVAGELSYSEGPPDLWHNTIMVAGRVRNPDAEIALTQRAISHWPASVDLLCDEFQLRMTSHYDFERAQEIWKTLQTMLPGVTAPSWRYWVYGAYFTALQLRDRDSALRLLDNGLRAVNRDALQNILDAYRRVLVDSPPTSTLRDLRHVSAYQRRALDLLEQRYRLGIELGVENAYTLASHLATLYQERAGSSIQSQDANQDNLLTALQYLDLAERLYTGNSNHPIWDIYVVRIRILMAQHRYGDALRFLTSLPDSLLQRDPSLVTMLNLARNMTGEKPPQETPKKADTETISEAIGLLLSNEAAMLTEIAAKHPDVRAALIKCVSNLT